MSPFRLGAATAEIVVREIAASEAGRVAELDRSESVAMLFEVRGGAIVPLARGCEIPQWSGAWLEEEVALVRDQLQSGAALGAFAGRRLAGLGVVGFAPVRGDPRELQLAFLHVGREHRRCGIAGRLFRGLRGAALRRGALRLYVSATPSESALGFYRSLGARLADPVDPDLFAREPEDVHLVLEL